MPRAIIPWTAIHQKKYIWLFNYIKTFKPDIDQETFLSNFNKKNLINYINKNDTWGDSSKESLFFMIARWLEINKPNDTYISNFKELGYKLKQKRDNIEGENKLDKKEKENYKDYEYFLNILNDIKPDDIKTQTEHYKYLILALLVLQPPLRTSFYNSAKFVKEMRDMKLDENYIWMTFQGKPRAYYIVNKDKVSNSKSYKNKADLANIPIEDNRLVQILYDSFEKYPREYLFENKGRPMKQETLLNYLRSITHLNAVNIDMLRASYISHFYEHNKTYNEREVLSKKMRHSTATAQRNYLKVSDKPSSKNEELEQLKAENIRLQVQIKELEDQLKQAKPADDKLFNKRRKDVIYTINNNKAKPKESTLTKYNIKYNEETNKYV